MKYYVADLHFGHYNIIKHDGRPYANVEEMDNDLINKWNSVVTDKDEVYIIGDFAFRNCKSVKTYADKLKGKKILILGNHDKSSDHLNGYFKQITQMKSVTFKNI